MAKKKKDYSRQILERIVGTKRKTEIAEKLKLAFAEKNGVRKEELKSNIETSLVQKSTSKNKIIEKENKWKLKRDWNN